MDWHEIAKYLWGLLVPAGWWIFNKQDKRMDALEQAMKDRVSHEEFHRHREDNRQEHRDFVATMKELFRNAEADRKVMHDKMDQISREQHEMHVELLNKVGDR